MMGAGAMATVKKRGRKAPPRARRTALVTRKTGEAGLKQQLAEARAQQAATAAILKVIARSPSDVQPVFDSIVRSTSKLCKAPMATVILFDGAVLRLAFSSLDAKRMIPFAKLWPMPIERAGVQGVVVRERTLANVRDVATDKRVAKWARPLYRSLKIRSGLWVPMLRERKVVGLIAAFSPELDGFGPASEALLQTFADHAVIAIENARRFNEAKEALEQQKASGEVLDVISSSIADTAPVFDKILESCERLFAGRIVGLNLVREDGMLHLGAYHGAHRKEFDRIFPLPLTSESGSGLAIVKRRIVHYPDAQHGKEVPPRTRQGCKAIGIKSVIFAPMLWEGRGVGAIFVGRDYASTFSAKEIALLKTFADQAAIAVENVRLFNETKEALERQTATAEILKVIASSPTKVQPVFDAIAASALRLFSGHSAAVTRVVGDAIHLAAFTATNEAGNEALRSLFPRPLASPGLYGTVARSGKPATRADIENDPEAPPEAKAMARARGFRSALGVPMLREGVVVGTINVTRREPGLFTDHQIGLLQTFADQAVIAIENARLFNETKEALEQQTATAEVLRAISGSPNDIRPIFETLVRAAARFCGAPDVTIMPLDGNVLRGGAACGTFAEIVVRELGSVQALQIPVTRASVSGRAVVERRAIHVHDLVAESEDEYPNGRAMQRQFGHRTMVAAPLLREGVPIGVIALFRREVRPFAENQLSLLQTFADQAVIAIENVRLFNETKEALERQTATAEILKVIASSPSDVQPVFDAIARSAYRLIGGFSTAVARVFDDVLQLVAFSSTDEAGNEALKHAFPMAVSRSKAARTGEPVSISDTETLPASASAMRELARTRGFRSILIVPMLREGVAIGTISVTRREPAEFSHHQVDLLQTFADQAVIAIENVRLFNETKEALERQTATAEILKVISESPTDIAPVFRAILEKATRLSGSQLAALWMYEGGDIFRAVAGYGQRPEFSEWVFGKTHRFGPPFFRPGGPWRAGQVADVRETESYLRGDEIWIKSVEVEGIRTMLIVPLVREKQLVGGIAIYRREVQPFSSKQIDLVSTFADQAVIAIENVRLFNETKEALERQTATAEILKVIASSPADVQPVFDAIAMSAARLFGRRASLRVVEEGGLRRRALSDSTRENALAAELMPISRDSLVGRVVLEGKAIQLPDTLAPDAPPYAQAHAHKWDFRSNAIAPFIRDGKVIGTIGVNSPEPGALSDKQMALLATFADQAVIAIENVRLFNETKEALEQQTATADVLKVIASSPADVQPVFNAILRSAVNLCGAEIAAVFPYDGKLVHLGATHNWSAEAKKYFSTIYPAPPSPALMSGRVILGKSIVKLADAAADGHYDPNSTATGHWRRMLGVPMMREDQPLGALVVCWREPGETPQRQVDLLQTFADQASIAIENVRLFNETKEALERQTATAEILKVISSSPTDTQPVFEAIARNVVRLCDGLYTYAGIFDGKILALVAFHNVSPQALAILKERFPSAPIPASSTGRALLERAAIHIPDVMEDAAYPFKDLARADGYRAILAVPMLREGTPIGVIAVGRRTPFSEDQIELVKTFAAQAVIAIENVRLFKELESRTEALTKSVGQLTALGEVGQAISSTLDLETVLQTIVSRAVQLTGLDGGSIYEYDEANEEFRLQASDNQDRELLEAIRRTPIRKGDGTVGGTAVTLEATQVPDILDAGYKSSRKELLVRAGYRAILTVPLLREDRVMGALSVTRKTPGPFAPEIVELLKTFATQSAMAIQNARLFREIAEKGKQLEVASRHKSDFLASMSHELRTPLNAILGFNEMILGQIYGEVPKDMQEPLEDIQKSGKHLLRLINNVLDLAKIEAGRMELALSDYSVHDTVESVRSTLRPLAAEKGLEFIATLPNDLPLAYGDSGRITQCLMNLAGNSLKFTKAGKVEISVVARGDLLVFKVADTGVGIPPDKIDSLFTEFKQTDATIASEYGGTGLGLSISKKFVEMHGGRIWIESELGKGSAFIFEVPLRVKTP